MTRNQLMGATFLGAAAVLGSLGTAHADLMITQNDGTAFTISDAGGSGPGLGVPVGTTGLIGSANLFAETAGNYTFTYYGAGDSSDPNSFTVNVPGGGTFCSQAGLTACGGAATTTKASFTVSLTAGEEIPYTFVANSGTNGTLTDSDPAGDPPYMSSVFTGYANGCTGPSCPQVWLGLTDSPGTGVTGDRDFQDLSVLVTETPEPASAALLGSALIGMAFGFRRRTRKLDRKS